MLGQVPSIHPDSQAILLNKGVLSINDDPLGRMPFRYSIDSATGIELWRKELVGGDVRCKKLLSLVAVPQHVCRIGVWFDTPALH